MLAHINKRALKLLAASEWSWGIRWMCGLCVILVWVRQGARKRCRMVKKTFLQRLKNKSHIESNRIYLQSFNKLIWTVALTTTAIKVDQKKLSHTISLFYGSAFHENAAETITELIGDQILLFALDAHWTERNKQLNVGGKRRSHEHKLYMYTLDTRNNRTCTV